LSGGTAGSVAQETTSQSPSSSVGAIEFPATATVRHPDEPNFPIGGSVTLIEEVIKDLTVSFLERVFLR
jgi:hypothetical protein